MKMFIKGVQYQSRRIFFFLFLCLLFVSLRALSNSANSGYQPSCVEYRQVSTSGGYSWADLAFSSSSTDVDNIRLYMIEQEIATACYNLHEGVSIKSIYFDNLNSHVKYNETDCPDHGTEMDEGTEVFFVAHKEGGEDFVQSNLAMVIGNYVFFCFGLDDCYYSPQPDNAEAAPLVPPDTGSNYCDLPGDYFYEILNAFCGTNEYVVNGSCTTCPAGTETKTNHSYLKENTECTPVYCTGSANHNYTGYEYIDGAWAALGFNGATDSYVSLEANDIFPVGASSYSIELWLMIPTYPDCDECGEAGVDMGIIGNILKIQMCVYVCVYIYIYIYICCSTSRFVTL